MATVIGALYKLYDDDDDDDDDEVLVSLITSPRQQPAVLFTAACVGKNVS